MIGRIGGETMLPWIGDYVWQKALLSLIEGFFALVGLLFLVALAINIKRIPKILPEIFGWTGFLLQLLGVLGLILSAIYITLRIVFLSISSLANYEWLMLISMGATLIGLFTLRFNLGKGRTQFEWAFVENISELRVPVIGHISFILLRAGIVGLLVWGGWLSQIFDLFNFNLDSANLNHFTLALIFSILSAGVGQIFKISGHDTYIMSIDEKGILTLRFEFVEKPRKKKKR